jgi:hypothetical protein
MRLLSRSTPSPYDEHLTYFTVSEANEFRRLVGRSFAAAGRDVDVHPDHVEDRSGTTFQLWNIGFLCIRAEPHDWAGLIEEHVRLVTTPTRDLADLSQPELEAGLSLRLVETASVPDPDSLAYARVVAPGLLEVLSVDLVDSVATPLREELAELGPIGELLARGRDNLRALLVHDGLRAESDDDGGLGRFTAVTGDSFFTASLALLLEETVEHFTGEDDWGRGVLVAVPCRHRLLYRTIDTADTAEALRRMHHDALRGFSREAGPLSPDVYWVRGHRWAQATSWEGGKSRLLRGTGLREALKGL